MQFWAIYRPGIEFECILNGLPWRRFVLSEWFQWRRNRGFRTGAPNYWAPEEWSHRKFLGETLGKMIKIVATR